jgi:hypothetical protein
MPHLKTRRQSDNEIRARIRKELAKPRMAKSAKIASLNLGNEHGHKVKLKKLARVDVPVTANGNP